MAFHYARLAFSALCISSLLIPTHTAPLEGTTATKESADTKTTLSESVNTVQTDETVAEDPNFNPYEKEKDTKEEKETNETEDKNIESYDFDPSEGLTFELFPREIDCFYENVKFDNDVLTGAFIADTEGIGISFEILDADDQTIGRQDAKVESSFRLKNLKIGTYKMCFHNPDDDSVIITFVTKLLQSQHPVERTHVNALGKYASHLDIKLGEIESEQRLEHVRTDRYIKVREATSRRLVMYGTLECIVYLFICFIQVVYIKRLLSSKRPWV